MTPRGRFARLYGTGPLHLLLLLAAFALAAYAAVRMVQGDPVGVAIWFVGGAVLHDLAFVWLVASGDLALGRLALPSESTGVPAVNHVRVPAFLSGLLLLIWFPLILRLPTSFEDVTGYTTEPYLGRWLLVSGALFAGSAVIYVVRVARATIRRRHDA